MKTLPILFSAPMVRALLAGRKTQTRRVLRPLPKVGLPLSDGWTYAFGAGGWGGLSKEENGGVSSCPLPRSPYGIPGDRLWVRETWAYRKGNGITPVYRADADPPLDTQGRPIVDAKWGPSIFMPRWASRITLEVTEVRVQRVQDISEVDAQAEGADNHWCGVPRYSHVGCCGYRVGFRKLWDSINGKRPGCAWADNPWVWAISFKRVDAPGGAA